MKLTNVPPAVNAGKPQPRSISPAISPPIAAKLEKAKHAAENEFSLMIEFSSDDADHLDALAAEMGIDQSEVFVELLRERVARAQEERAIAEATGLAASEWNEPMRRAATTAVAEHLASYGELSVPIRMAVVPAAELPLFLEQDVGRLLFEFCEAADVDPDGYVTNMVSDMIDTAINVESVGLEGIAGDMLDAYTFKNDAERSAVMERFRAILQRERERRSR